uniref:Uncharacterized protein n=1 Tax=Rhizophora mucronata TaxID=61149 RepID=A0A2P2QZ86_RHIMU
MVPSYQFFSIFFSIQFFFYVF